MAKTALIDVKTKIDNAVFFFPRILLGFVIILMAVLLLLHLLISKLFMGLDLIV